MKYFLANRQLWRKSMTFFFRGLFLVLLAPFYLSASSVQTQVSFEAVFSQVWRNSYPSKFLECWGKPDEIKNFQNRVSSDDDEAFSQNSGTFGGSHIDSKAAQFSPSFTPQVGDWNSSLNEERVWTLSFSQKVNLGETKYRHHKCSTERFVSKLGAISNTFRSQARLVVPPDVYLLRVKRNKLQIKSTTTHQLESFLQIVPDDPDLESSPQYPAIPVNKEFAYYMVSPGQTIDFVVQWESQALEDASFDVEYEIKMSGYDDCAKDLGQIDNLTETGFAQLINDKFTPKNFFSEPHQSISALSCLRSKSYLGKILGGEHASKLVVGLEVLFRNIDEFNLAVHTAEPNFWSEKLALSARMSLYEIARTLLADLYKFCDTRSVFNLVPGEGRTIDVRGYHYAARKYYKIKLLFDQAPLDLLETFGDTFQELGSQNLSYQDIDNSENFELLREIKNSVFNRHFRVPDLVSDHLKDLPGSFGQDSIQKEVKIQLDQAILSYQKVDDAFDQQILKLVNKSTETINAKDFLDLLVRYRLQLDELHSALRDNIDWFSMERSSSMGGTQFQKDMNRLNTNMLRIVGEILNGRFVNQIGAESSFDFIRKKQMDQLFENVQSCLLEAP